ncbi:MAG: HD domain-containing protein [Chloroflexi bacterium]|nr:HD domain-containing protein [Chloroflexota bacterium]
MSLLSFIKHESSENGLISADIDLLHLLLDVADDLSHASLEGILTSLIHRLKSYYGASHACLHLVEGDLLRDEAVEAALASCPVHEAAAHERPALAQIESTLNALSLAQGKPLTLGPGTQNDTGWEKLAQTAGITGGISIPLVHQKEPYGVINLYFSRACPTSVMDVSAVRALGNLTYSAIQKELHLRALREHEDVVAALSQAIEAKDDHTGGHVSRVMCMAESLGEAIGLEGRDRRLLRRAAVLHDLGKIGVPDTILNKPGKLTEQEFAKIRKHPEIAANILRHLDSEGIDEIIAGVRAHHEWWDGSGYPDGLAGEDIPLLAQIVAVVDTYDALTSDRPYRRAFSTQRALDILTEDKGRHLSPKLVDLFIEQQLYDLPCSESCAHLIPS